MAKVPTKSVYITDFGEAIVPPEWEIRFLHAEIEDLRNSRVPLLGRSIITPWDARNAAYREFEAAEANYGGQ